MTAVIIKFPPRGVFANAVRAERERGTDGWLTLADAFGSLHGDFASALREAHEIAASNGLAVVSTAPVTQRKFPFRNEADVNRLHARSRPDWQRKENANVR